MAAQSLKGRNSVYHVLCIVYSLLADRKPAVILLLRDPATEWRHLVRAAQVCGRLGIVLYVEPVSERIATP